MATETIERKEQEHPISWHTPNQKNAHATIRELTIELDGMLKLRRFNNDGCSFWKAVESTMPMT
jgi:hypothetical protein